MAAQLFSMPSHCCQSTWRGAGGKDRHFRLSCSTSIATHKHAHVPNISQAHLPVPYIYMCVCVPILLESPYAQRPIYFVHFKIFQVSRSLSANPRCINGRPFRWKASRAFAYLRKKMHERVEKSTKIPVAWNIRRGAAAVYSLPQTSPRLCCSV